MVFKINIQTISTQVKLAKLKENEAQLRFYLGMLKNGGVKPWMGLPITVATNFSWDKILEMNRKRTDLIIVKLKQLLCQFQIIFSINENNFTLKC